MTARSDINGFTEQMVRDCGLGSTSIFFYDQSNAQQRVSYLYHTGVSDEAQYAYATRGVFMSDPFARTAPDTNEFVRWGAPRIDPLLTQSPDYCGFLSHHDINVVGAWCRSLTPDLLLIIGTHRSASNDRTGDVPLDLLQFRLQKLSGMVVDHLFAQLLANSAGQIALRFALPAASGPVDQDVALSAREGEMAALICDGKQNKQVAWMLGISEFTVENHLRRIYRKLGIHSRAALVAHFSRRPH